MTDTPEASSLTDRELLEFAAKAAGIEGEYHAIGIYHRPCAQDGRSYWNPLNDDAQALRLAVKLGLVLNLSPREDCRGQTVVTYQGFCKVEEPCHDGREVAARRAIVRAAAAIGRAAA